MSQRGFVSLLILAVSLSALSLVFFARQTRPPVGFSHTPISLSALGGWQDDDLDGVLDAFATSCEAILRAPPERPLARNGTAGTGADWRGPCEAASRVPGDAAARRRFFEDWFTAFAVRGRRSAEGLFTGYYVPVVLGRLTPGDGFEVPLYARPDDLVSVDLGLFRPSLAGERVAGRVEGGALKPYPDRGAITGGALDGRGAALVWLADPVDAFFLQIQGSGLIELPGGRLLRVGYAAQNGHPYTSIGRLLVERGHMPLADVSMQSIRAWLAANPGARDEILNANASYVFFRHQETSQNKGGAIGSQGVPLTAGRSLAVDRRHVPLGVPVWLESWPAEAESDEPTLRRLLIAQDTGGAIRGAVRGDVFWGAGDEAGARAGTMRHRGRYFVLLPKPLAARLEALRP